MTLRVLDSSAVLAVLFEEPGANVAVRCLNEGACVSAVNWSEVLSGLLRRHAPVTRTEEDLSVLQGEYEVDVVPFDETQALLAARLQPITDARGLSLGDRSCLALAQVRRLPVVTADRVWTEVDVGVAVELIR